MHLTAYVESPDHVCCRYRLAAFDFQAEGHQLSLHPFPSGLIAPWWPRTRAKVVIVQRRLLSTWRLRWLCHDSQLVFDFDDAIWLRDSYAAKGLHSRRRLSRFRKVVQRADAVVAGNDFLAEQASRFTRPDRVHVIPTCVDPTIYRLSDHSRNGSAAKLVWVGSASTLKGLQQISNWLGAVARAVPGIGLALVADRFASFPPMTVTEVPWSASAELSELANADIGIAWMPDDDWSRGKCGLKVLQYMAAGLPVVANSVGVHRTMIRHGQTGFLADNQREWVEAIRFLAVNPGERRRMGLAGRRLVEDAFSTRVGAQRWRELLSRLTEDTPITV